MPRSLQFSLRALFGAMSAAGLLCLIFAPLLRHADPAALAFLALWLLSQTLHLALGWFALRQQRKKREPPLNSLIASAIGGILPLLALVLFLWVFVIGGSSNVAKLAGAQGRTLWRLWFSWWPALFLGLPVTGLVLLGAALSPPYPPDHWKSFLSRWCGVVAALCAWCAVVWCFPDA